MAGMTDMKANTKINTKANTRVILFYSPCGGCGKTLLSAYTAIHAAQKGYRTLLMDLSPFAGLMPFFGIPVKTNGGLAEVSTYFELHQDTSEEESEQGKLNEEGLRSVIRSSIHKNEAHPNLELLLHNNPIKLDAMGEKEMRSFIRRIRAMPYDYVLVDIGSDINARTYIMLEEADDIYIPCRQDISCGWSVLCFKRVYEKCGFDTGKLKLVINQCSRKSGFHNQEFVTETGLSLAGEIPLFRSGFQSDINRGIQPSVRFRKKERRQLRTLFDAVLGGEMRVSS